MASSKKYRIKKDAPEHYIGGRFVKPGEVFTLPDGVKPGQHLEPVSEREAAAADSTGDGSDAQ